MVEAGLAGSQGIAVGDFLVRLMGEGGQLQSMPLQKKRISDS